MIKFFTERVPYWNWPRIDLILHWIQLFVICCIGVVMFLICSS